MTKRYEIGASIDGKKWRHIAGFYEGEAWRDGSMLNDVTIMKEIELLQLNRPDCKLIRLTIYKVKL